MTLKFFSVILVCESWVQVAYSQLLHQTRFWFPILRSPVFSRSISLVKTGVPRCRLSGVGEKLEAESTLRSRVSYISGPISSLPSVFLTCLPVWVGKSQSGVGLLISPTKPTPLGAWEGHDLVRKGGDDVLEVEPRPRPSPKHRQDVWGIWPLI